MEKQNIQLTTDSVILLKTENGLKILLVKRKIDPFQGKWALPGGFLKNEEPLEEGAIRELKEETGLSIERLHQIKTFGTPGRDPRGRTITVAFLGKVASEEKVRGNDDASDAAWFYVNELPELAFDHSLIIEAALKQHEQYSI